jgi:tight adherence protein B
MGIEILITLTVFVAVSAAILAAFQSRSATAAITQARLDRVTGRVDYSTYTGGSLALRGNRMSSIAWVERALSGVDFAQSLDMTLRRAAWNMRVAELLAISTLCGGVAFCIGTFLLQHWLIGVVLGVFAAYIPIFLVQRAAKRRIGKIEKQLVELLMMMSNSLKAGFGLMQAVDQASRQMEEPIASELRQLTRDTQIGSSVEEAVTDFGRRIGSYDLEIVVTAILVQRNVGGNLSEIFDNVAHTMRERERIRGEIATLTAQQKLTGYIIGGLPVALALIFFVMNRDYMMLLFTEPVGRLMLLGAVIMEVIGVFIIRKIINIDV